MQSDEARAREAVTRYDDAQPAPGQDAWDLLAEHFAAFARAAEARVLEEAAGQQCQACLEGRELSTWNDHPENADDLESGVHVRETRGLREFHGFAHDGEPIWCEAPHVRSLAAKHKDGSRSLASGPHTDNPTEEREDV